MFWSCFSLFTGRFVKPIISPNPNHLYLVYIKAESILMKAASNGHWEIRRQFSSPRIFSAHILLSYPGPIALA